MIDKRYSGRSRESEPSLEKWSYSTLKEQLVNASAERKNGVATFDRLPKNIEIGNSASSLGGRAEYCRLMTEFDPTHKERGAIIMFDPQTRRLMTTTRENVFTGDDESVNMTFRSMSRGRTIEDVVEGRTSESTTLCIGTIHSHPDASSFSGADMAGFLTNSEHMIDILAPLDGRLRAIVASHETVRMRNDNDAILEVDQEVLSERYREMVRRNAQAMARRNGYRLGSNVVQDKVYIWKSMDAVIAKLAEEKKFAYYIGNDQGQLKRFRLKSK